MKFGVQRPDGAEDELNLSEEEGFGGDSSSANLVLAGGVSSFKLPLYLASDVHRFDIFPSRRMVNNSFLIWWLKCVL